MGKLSRARALAVGAGIVLLSIAGLWFASMQTGTTQAVVASVASALLSIGSLSLVYELAMRDEIQEELIGMVGVERSTARCRLQQMVPFDEFRWPLLIDNATSIKALLSNPEPWVIAVFSRLVDAACRHKVDIELLIPSFASTSHATLSEYLRLSPQQLADSLARAADSAERTWKARSTALYKGSSLKVRSFDGLCVGALIIIDRAVISISYLPGGNRGAGLETGLVSVFDVSQEAFPGSAFERHLALLGSTAALIYENKRS